MLQYTAEDGTRRIKMTAEEKAEAGIRPSAKVMAEQQQEAARLADLRARIAAAPAAHETDIASGELVVPKRERPGNWIDSAMAGAMGDTSMADSGLVRGGANMAGNLARDFAIISAITIAAICLLRFLARRLRERTGLTVTDAPKKLGALWVKFQRDE